MLSISSLIMMKLYLIESVNILVFRCTLAGLEGEVQSNDHASVKDLFSRVFVRENLL